jgi:glycosyltransferase involved in cell wall biosynthesis
VSDKIRVSFIGRIDVGKGIQATLDIFNKLSENPEIELAFYGTFWENDPDAKRIHQQLSQQESFTYIPVNFHGFSDKIDHLVRDVFRDTDIFIQPYKKLSSTIDIPVLVLEAMASLSAVITTPVGDIPSIYPKSHCIIPYEQLVNDAIPLITSGRKWLSAEREKIWSQNKLLHFDTHSIVDHLIQALTT